MISVSPTIVWDHESGLYLASTQVEAPTMQPVSASAPTFDQAVSALAAAITALVPGDAVQLVLTQPDVVVIEADDP